MLELVEANKFAVNFKYFFEITVLGICKSTSDLLPELVKLQIGNIRPRPVKHTFTPGGMLEVAF